MQRIAAILFLGLFLLQVGVKTTIVFYYNVVDTKTAAENCEYKTITVCKGSCYVKKQIKIVSSATNKETQPLNQIDISSLKDITCEPGLQNSLTADSFTPLVFLIGYQTDHYSFNYTSDLIKPPCA